MLLRPVTVVVPASVADIVEAPVLPKVSSVVELTGPVTALESVREAVPPPLTMVVPPGKPPPLTTSPLKVAKVAGMVTTLLPDVMPAAVVLAVVPPVSVRVPVPDLSR